MSELGTVLLKHYNAVSEYIDNYYQSKEYQETQGRSLLLGVDNNEISVGLEITDELRDLGIFEAVFVYTREDAFMSVVLNIKASTRLLFEDFSIFDDTIKIGKIFIVEDCWMFLNERAYSNCFVPGVFLKTTVFKIDEDVKGVIDLNEIKFKMVDKIYDMQYRNNLIYLQLVNSKLKGVIIKLTFAGATFNHTQEILDVQDMCVKYLKNENYTLNVSSNCQGVILDIPNKFILEDKEPSGVLVVGDGIAAVSNDFLEVMQKVFKHLYFKKGVELS